LTFDCHRCKKAVNETIAMNEPCAFIYSSRFGEDEDFFGADHPFKILRYRLTFDLLGELGLLDGAGIHIVECPYAPEEVVLGYHDPNYIQTLKEFSLGDSPRANFFYGLGDVENPVFRGLYDWARLVCGGTLEALRQVVEKGCRLAFNMAGGWHHAHRARASGFSYLNDAVLAINEALRRGLRVAYIDIDAHHGDGVQEAFFRTERVLTISLHESGEDFFPQTGSVWEMGRGKGYGYSVNIPLLAHSDDLVFEQAFRRCVIPLIESFKPDVLVTQLGVDALRTDPLTRLELTTGAFEFAARALLDTGLPWVALGGGGYERLNVARTWSLIWAVMTGNSLGDRVPPGFAATAARYGLPIERIRDCPRLAHPDDFARAQKVLEKNLGILERKIFPLHGLNSRGDKK
jgi:acetoin utilization protein AcuC